MLFLLVVWLLGSLLKAAKRANRVDWGSNRLNLIDGLIRLFCYRYHGLNIIGLRLPKTGPAIIVSNHVSGLDSLLLIASARRPLRFVIARKQYQRFGLTWMFKAAGMIPVDRERRPEQALRVALRALKSGEAVALFPHGTIHLDSDPPRKLKPGAARLAQMANAPILPLRITGIRGEGYIVRGLLRRSTARVEAFPSITPAGKTFNQLQDEMQKILDGDSLSSIEIDSDPTP